MGFTIEDMLTLSGDRYRMSLVAGSRGWANSISWVLMVEDLTVLRNFGGKELAVTTGVGFDSEEKLLSLVRALDDHHASGLIVNTGFYIDEIPGSLESLCDELDLPLLTVPWDIYISEMIKDLSVRIFFQGMADEQITAAFIKAIGSPDQAAAASGSPYASASPTCTASTSPSRSPTGVSPRPSTSGAPSSNSRD